MCMKTKERVTQWPIIDRAFWQKMHQFRDNGRQSIGLFGRKCTGCAVIRGEARMLPKGKAVIALLLPRNHGIRHPDARQGEILRYAQDDSEGHGFSLSSFWPSWAAKRLSMLMTVQGAERRVASHCLLPLPTAYCLLSVQGAERRGASRRSCVRRLRVNSAKDLALVFA
jgi:hypothetical protein